MFTIMHLPSPLYSLDMDSLATKEVGGGWRQGIGEV